MQVYDVLVRRDAHTTTPVTIPEHELALLQELFGEENVHNIDGKRIDEKGLGESVGEVKESDDEYARLAAKYGHDLIDAVYGKKASKGLETAMASFAKKVVKPAAKPAKE